MAKKKTKTKTPKPAAKKKKKKKSAAQPAVFHGKVFSFLGLNEGEIVQSAPNKFSLVPFGFEDLPHPLLYKLKNEGPPNGVTALWENVQFVYVPGKPFDMQFGPPEDPNMDTRRKKRMDKTKERVLNFDETSPIPFEHLVGISQTSDGQPAVVRLFLAEKNDPDGTRGIIAGLVFQQAGSPSGAGVGNG
jgi:hypothetical protein